MDAREKLLEVAAKIYAEAGYRGTTTRRIAEEAGVNEVTLFRHFGTKDALIKAALEAVDYKGRPKAVDEPSDPAADLYAYAWATYSHFYRHRHLASRLMGDMVDHPGMMPLVCEEPGTEYGELVRYFNRIKELGLTRREFPVEGLAGMLTGALLTHALWQDYFPNVPPAEEVVRQYVDLALMAIGVPPASPALKPSR